MDRQAERQREFWSPTPVAPELDLSADAGTEDIRPGGGAGWEALWNGAVDVTEEAKWAEFLGGDATNKREVAWLLS